MTSNMADLLLFLIGVLKREGGKGRLYTFPGKVGLGLVEQGLRAWRRTNLFR